MDKESVLMLKNALIFDDRDFGGWKVIDKTAFAGIR